MQMSLADNCRRALKMLMSQNKKEPSFLTTLLFYRLKTACFIVLFYNDRLTSRCNTTWVDDCDTDDFADDPTKFQLLWFICW